MEANELSGPCAMWALSSSWAIGHSEASTVL